MSLGFAIGGVGVTGDAKSAGNATIYVVYAASFRERRLDVRFAPLKYSSVCFEVCLAVCYSTRVSVANAVRYAIRGTIRYAARFRDMLFYVLLDLPSNSGIC